MNKLIRSLIAGSVAAFIAVTAAFAQLPAGAISVGSVSGDASFAAAGSTAFKPLVAGAALPQGATVKTGAGASATLVFSSGSTASISANSVVELTKFEQEAFSGPVPTKGEPSISNTEINVIEGTVAAKVNKLKKGSSYTINSPVGAAGVRGTTLVVSFNSATQQLTVTTIEGLVVLSARAGGQTAEVAAGESARVVETITVTGGVENRTGTVVTSVEITPEVQEALVLAVAQIAPELAVEVATAINNAGGNVTVPDAPTTVTPQQESIVVIPDTTVIVSPN